MRRSILSRAQAAARGSWPRPGFLPFFPTSFVCAGCRRAALQTSPNTRTAHRRAFAFSTIDRKPPRASPAQDPHHPPPPPPPRPSTSQTHYDLFPQTFPHGPPPHSPFSLDLRQLRKEFLQLQAKAHPDLAPAEHKRPAEALSSRINEAYKTLQDPLTRAQYLLSLHGIDVEDDSAKLSSESALLMEVMEAREAVEAAADEDEVAGLRTENRERIDRSVRALDEAFANGEMDRAAHEAVRLRYWVNIDESIHGWEKGKGGGLIHH